MTNLFFVRLRGVLAAVAGVGLVVGSSLWVQHTRGGWPFRAEMQTLAAQATPPASTRPQPEHDRVPIDVSDAMIRELGVRVEAVGRQTLTEELRAVATVAPDESRISHVHTRVSGWVEQLDVNTTGEAVTAGLPLARIFSQELFSSQAEYLTALKNTAAAGITSAVVASGRTRLGVLGMSPAEIDGIERTGEPRRLVTIVAPRSGVVVNRGVTVGTAVDPSTTLLTIADLSSVWVLAEVPEANIPGIRVGTRALLDFPASGRRPFAARVDFIYPTLTERTRTLRIRFSAGNADGTLRPGLYGTAVFEVAGPPVVTVPRDAVVDTGRLQHVFVADGNRFEPRPVTVGVQLADRVEIRSGLREGERIVAAGVFLLDSESRLRATGAGGGHTGHGSPGAPPASAPPTPAPPADPHAGHRM